MEKVYHTILERLNNLIVVANPEGGVEYVSPSVKNMLGFNPSDLLGEGWWKNTKSEQHQSVTFIEHIKTLFDKNDAFSTKEVVHERQVTTALGERKWILWNTSFGPDDKIISIGSDITKRKLAEHALAEQNQRLKQKNEDILDSILYARKIQQAILPSIDKIAKKMADAFVLYLPKDVVSGDFYWYHQVGNQLFVVAADCTGHGVPGALMSVIGVSILKELIIKRGIESPAEILLELDAEINSILQKEESYDVMSDGMDIALVKIDLEKLELIYAGAMRPLWHVRDGELVEFKGSRFPIGYFYGVKKHFENTTICLQPRDQIYLFSDGFADQFGGEHNKKFNKKKLKELLLSVQNLTGEEKNGFLEYALKNWKQEEEQTDDVLIIGLEI